MKHTVVGLVIFLLVVISAWAGAFRDNFGDGNIDEWNVWEGADQSGKWVVENGVLVGISKSQKGFDTSVFLGEQANAWKDYEFFAQFLLNQTFPNDFNSSTISFLIHASREGFVALDVFSNGKMWNQVSCRKNVGGNEMNVDVVNFAIAQGRWHTTRIIADGNHYQMFIDDKPICDFQSNLPDRGGIVMRIVSCEVHFDNVVITGDDIPDQNLAVFPQGNLTAVWGQIKGF